MCGGHRVVLCKATRWPVIWEERRGGDDRRDRTAIKRLPSVLLIDLTAEIEERWI